MSLDDALNILSPDYPLTDAEDAGTPIYDEVFAPLLEARAAEAEAEAKRQADTYEAIHLCKAAARESNTKKRDEYIADAMGLDPKVTTAWLAEREAAAPAAAGDTELKSAEAGEPETTPEGNES